MPHLRRRPRGQSISFIGARGPPRSADLVGLPACLVYSGSVTDGLVRSSDKLEMRPDVYWGPEGSIDGGGTVAIDGSSRRKGLGLRGGWGFYWGRRDLRGVLLFAKFGARRGSPCVAAKTCSGLPLWQPDARFLILEARASSSQRMLKPMSDLWAMLPLAGTSVGGQLWRLARLRFWRLAKLR